MYVQQAWVVFDRTHHMSLLPAAFAVHTYIAVTVAVHSCWRVRLCIVRIFAYVSAVFIVGVPWYIPVWAGSMVDKVVVSVPVRRVLGVGWFLLYCVVVCGTAVW